MKNGYSPKKYAFAIAIDALRDAFHNRQGELDGLTVSDTVATKDQIHKLVESLALQANLDVGYLSEDLSNHNYSS